MPLHTETRACCAKADAPHPPTPPPRPASSTPNCGLELRDPDPSVPAGRDPGGAQGKSRGQPGLPWLDSPPPTPRMALQ